MRIGILGGSFNPVHNGHLKLAQAAYSELNLSEVIFVPSRQNPLKKKEDLLPDTLRLKLLRQAVKATPYFSVSDCEMRRKGLSFTVDTLEYFKKKFGREAILYFLTGSDTLLDLSRWKSLTRVFELCHFVVMTRPGYPIKECREPLLVLPFDALDISASGLRERIKNRQNIKGLVPPPVVQALTPMRRMIKSNLARK